MAKFKVLKYSQSLMARVGITDSIKNFFNSIVFFGITFSFIVLVTSSVTLLRTHPTEFEIVSQGLIQIIASVQFFGAFFYTGLNVNKIQALSLKLQEIVDLEQGTISLILFNETQFLTNIGYTTINTVRTLRNSLVLTSNGVTTGGGVNVQIII